MLKKKEYIYPAKVSRKARKKAKADSAAGIIKP